MSKHKIIGTQTLWGPQSLAFGLRRVNSVTPEHFLYPPSERSILYGVDDGIKAGVCDREDHCDVIVDRLEINHVVGAAVEDKE